MITKVLVTGANSQLAKTIQEKYYKNSDDISFTFATKKDLDITNQNQLNSYFAKHSFDFCINCAAYTNVEQAERTPEIAFKTNAEAVKNLTKSCKSTKTILIHISTDYVFDGNKQTPYTELDLPMPVNNYGKSKLLGEQYIQESLDQYFIVRTSWLYSRHGKNFVKTIAAKLKNNETLSVITSEIGTATSCDSLSSFLYFIISNNLNFGIYHFSGNQEISWYDFAKEIASHFKLYPMNCLKRLDKSYSSLKRPKYSVLDNTKRNIVFNKEYVFAKEIKEVVSLL